MTSKITPLTFYEIMGVQRGSTTLDVKNQYELLKEIYSADNPMMRCLFDTEGLFIYNKLLLNVCQSLLDPDIRKEYDMEMEDHLESLKQSLPEDFNIRELIKKYNKQKKVDPKLVKRDMYGREADAVPAVIPGHDDVDINAIFKKYADKLITGEVLKAIREEALITVKAVADNTKISNFVIKSIEDDNYGNLPAVIYVKGFLKSYCKALKLMPENIEKIIDDYIAVMSGRKFPVRAE